MPTQHGINVDGTAYVVYQYGVRALFSGHDGLPTNRLEISGTEGMMMIDTQEAQLWKSSQNASFRGLARFPFPQMMSYTAPMVLLLEALLGAIKSGREPMSAGTPRVTR